MLKRALDRFDILRSQSFYDIRQELDGRKGELVMTIGWSAIGKNTGLQAATVKREAVAARLCLGFLDKGRVRVERAWTDYPNDEHNITLPVQRFARYDPGRGISVLTERISIPADHIVDALRVNILSETDGSPGLSSLPLTGIEVGSPEEIRRHAQGALVEPEIINEMLAKLNATVTGHARAA